jgi:hypothetical protein
MGEDTWCSLEQRRVVVDFDMGESRSVSFDAMVRVIVHLP